MDKTVIETLWHTRCPVPTPMGLASQLGWLKNEFSEDGISVRIVDETTNPLMRDAYLTHGLKNMFRQGGNAIALWARARGCETRVIGLNWIDESQLIITLPDSGIRRPRDLRGRRLGLPRRKMAMDHWRATALRGFIVTLETEGLTYKDVEFIDLPNEVFPDVKALHSVSGSTHEQIPPVGYTSELYALIRREVHAIYVKGAHGVQLARLLQAHVIADIRDHPDPLVRANCAAPRPITVDRDLIDSRPDIVARFLARVVAIGNWAKAHPAEAISYVARESKTTEEWARLAYGANMFKYLRTDLDEVAIAGLNEYKAFLLRWGFLKEDFDTWQWIAHEPLAEVPKYLKRNAA